jgi:TetR/AcrR family transcriptional regulator
MSFQELIEKEREQRRLYILDAAEELFFAKGFSSVTMEEIAKKVGLNKATIYLYFEDKDSLFFGIVLRKMRIHLRKLEDCAYQKNTGRERVMNMLSAGFAFTQENLEFSRLLCTTGPERFKDTDNPLAKVILEILMKEVFLVRDVLKDGIADGSVRGDLDPRVMASYITNSSKGISCTDSDWIAFLKAEGIGYQQYVADYLRFIDSAIAYPQGDGKSPVTKKSSGIRTSRKNP